MNIALFEDEGWRNLLPLTWLRSPCELRCGRDALMEKAAVALGGSVVRIIARPALRDVLDERRMLDEPGANDDWCLVNARALFTHALRPPPIGSVWLSDGEVVAAAVAAQDADGLDDAVLLDGARRSEWFAPLRGEPAPAGVRLIRYPWDLVLANAEELMRQCRGGGTLEGRIDPGVHLVDAGAIHVAREAVVKPGVVLDAESGPIVIERGARIEPNAVIQGPCFVGPGSIVRPGATLRGGVTIGPVCRVGGEIEASIFQGYSNKQHDGFVGHSFVGSWVNLGADTVTSDLKNTYGTIRVFLNGVGVETGQHFLGSIIGDHAKTGIGTILPTGCVLGLAANVFTGRHVPRFVPSFAWLTDDGMSRFRVEKAVTIARTVMARRDVELSHAGRMLLEHAAAQAADVEAAGWR